MARHRNKKAAKETAKAEAETGMKKSKLREYFESLIVAIILALFVKTFVLQTFQIPTGSMEDNLLIGDHLIVNKQIFGNALPLIGSLMPMREVRRGDVVIFKYPGNVKQDYIKRVIGLPGETLRILGHQILVDGTPIEELGMDEDAYTFQWRREDSERAAAIDADTEYDPRYHPSAVVDQTFEVPEGHYFMMGDHRSISRDSRDWGTVPREYITGRAVMIYWSYRATREDYKQENVSEQVGGFINGIINLPFKTRWDRLFRIVR